VHQTTSGFDLDWDSQVVLEFKIDFFSMQILKANFVTTFQSSTRTWNHELEWINGYTQAGPSSRHCFVMLEPPEEVRSLPSPPSKHVAATWEGGNKFCCACDVHRNDRHDVPAYVGIFIPTFKRESPDSCVDLSPRAPNWTAEQRAGPEYSEDKARQSSLLLL
jgi:hypothetical protein